MKRVLLIILLHLSLFFIIFAYQAQAEEENEWYVNDFGTYVVAAVSGEVIHGDKLRFFIKKEDCSKVAMMFSFSTSLKKDEIKVFEKQLEFNENEKIDKNETNTVNRLNILKNRISDDIIKKRKPKSKNLSILNFFNYLIVLIISFIALIIFLDTFKNNLSEIFPNLELFLYNLFETIKDLQLFFNDLFK